ncbi:MAG TPA: glycosyltransferase [Bacteroidia bacterium]|nr:glycosyltransferase [Bacteroidia bacterium]
MHSVWLIIFIVSVYLILHTYAIYPLWLLIFSKKESSEKQLFKLDEELPEVAILMAAYNEEKVIGDKIASVFNTSYPLQKIHFYIGSDASTDKTDEIIQEWHKKYPQINLIRFGGRTGKSGIINDLSDKATQEIFILTDANVIFKEDTIFNLIRHFKNENVAQVAANIIKVSPNNKGIASQEKSYIAIENKIKHQESLRWNVVMGAEGGCYAIRKSNFSKVPPKFFMDDFYITMNVIEQGKQIVFDKEAVCNEDVPTKSAEEFKRKVRISIGNFQNLMRYKSLLFSFNGISFAFWSHKVLRWLTPFLLITAFISTYFLMFHDAYFKILFLLQLFGFVTPVLDWLLRINIPLMRFVSHFYLMNLALLRGFIIYMKGVESNVWQPTKREVN